MPTTGNLNVNLSLSQTATRDLGSASDSASLTHTLSLIAGASGAQAIDRVWTDSRQLAASATEDLDLAGSALLDAFGVAVVFAKIKVLAIRAKATNTNNVVVGAAGANPWVGALNSTGTVTLRPGELLLIAVGPADTAGHTVTAGTGDLLKIANSAAGTAVDYEIAIAGTVA